ncbi:hypothetical protein BC938DRAFT_483409 [Jimgerdemannia flammicorona]|uniref:Uncharacterized protein n=1 Tax=Jimgerdemannia flammicorona TaxID=994334 RepID=A0A433QVZ0_9FUNG|nr:hypothetical protein BC938DRAFT_483409 [Jimgerdemannia flammicorona]
MNALRRNVETVLASQWSTTSCYNVPRAPSKLEKDSDTTSFPSSHLQKAILNEPTRGRTWNLLIRSQAPYPFGHRPISYLILGIPREGLRQKGILHLYAMKGKAAYTLADHWPLFSSWQSYGNTWSGRLETLRRCY